jgi:hypothetical protein
MPNVKKHIDPFATRVKDLLRKQLKSVGIDAKVTSNALAGTKLYRFLVEAPKFKNLDYSERQAVVWSIVRESVLPKDRVRISMILALTPDEQRSVSPLKRCT